MNRPPIIDIAPLFSSHPADCNNVMGALGDALTRQGVVVVTGCPDIKSVDALANSTLSFFDLPDSEKMAVATKRNRPDSNHTYRGYITTVGEDWEHNEMFDIGPERPVMAPPIKGVDVFAERNFWPRMEPVPGWRRDMTALHGLMERIGAALVDILAAHFGIPDDVISERFLDNGSTLRLINYPRRSQGIVPHEELSEVSGQPIEGLPLAIAQHVDASALSILWQRDPGLQAQTPDGEWLDVPMLADALSVHIGTAFEFMTGGRCAATPHRVLDRGASRQSIGYFHEPNLSANLTPVSDPGVDDIALCYGAHLLERFRGYRGYEHVFDDAK